MDHFRKLDRKTRVRLGLAVVLGILFIVFMVWPAWGVRPQLLAQIESFRSRNQTAQVQIYQEPKLLEERREHEAFIQKIQSRLFKEARKERIVGILAGIAEKSHVRLLGIAPREPEEEIKIPAPFDTKYDKASFAIRAEGDYHQLATFAREIENHPTILRVEEFSISPEGEDVRVHYGEVLLSAFFIKKKMEEPVG